MARNFEGNWTALFCTGAQQPLPPSWRQSTYRVANRFGYDGQMYRFLAHDPLLTGEPHQYMDNPPLRARRILMSGLAWILALGQEPWIDPAYFFLFFVSCFIGTYWMALYLLREGDPAWWSLFFLALPATLIAADRMVIDMPSCALSAGILWSSKSGNRRMLYVTLMLGCLCRETGLVFVAAFVISELLLRKWRQAVLLASSAIPAFAWYAYVQFRLVAVRFPVWLGAPEGVGPWRWLLHPFAYPLAPPIAKIAQIFDAVAIVGLLLAFVLAVVFGVKQVKDPVHLTALLFAASAVTTLDPRFWDSVYGYSRPYSPLLMILATHAITQRRWWIWMLPAAMMDLRIGFQISPQILGVFGVQAVR